MSRRPISAEDLESLRKRAEERNAQNLPECFADLLVPAHLLLELCIGYTPPPTPQEVADLLHRPLDEGDARA